MVECQDALRFLREMFTLIEETDMKAEQGFVVCERDRDLTIGARCADPGSHCTVKPPLCPEGGRPVLSFHTHSTRPPLINVVLGENPFKGETAKAALLPSGKDLAADMEIGTQVGCVGGNLNDGTGLVWCFTSFINSSEKEKAKSRVEALQKELTGILKTNESKREPRLLGLLVDYFDSVQVPCLELRLPLKG